jgi:hypothetical protein
MSTEKLYTTQAIPGKGRGLIATARISRGARILSESPLFKVPRDTNDLQLLKSIIARELKNLNKDQQRAFLTLHNAHQGSENPFLGIARTNALPLGSGAAEGGIFLEASRINHSCSHNAQNTWNANLHQLTIHVFKEVEKGEEITISYLPGSEHYTQRQMTLQKNFGFTCTCQLCSLPLAQRQESDRRLNEITRLDSIIGDGMSIVSTPLACLRHAHTLLLLLKEEGIIDARIPRLYYDALQITIANGDQARAKVFANRAHTERLLLEGDDSPETIRLKSLAASPVSHRLYGTTMRWKQAAGKVPKGLSEHGFEDWLWRKAN